MYELIQVGERTYYIDCPAKIGVYVTGGDDVYIIDSGNDKEAGKKILKILGEKNWNLKGIINTHANGDHIGGNQFLQQKTGCKIISTELENIFTKYTILEPAFLYGGYPFKELRNKFLMAAPSEPTDNIEEFLPEGLEFLRLEGHYFDMIGIKTSDDVYFLADCLSGEISSTSTIFPLFTMWPLICRPWIRWRSWRGSSLFRLTLRLRRILSPWSGSTGIRSTPLRTGSWIFAGSP